MKAKTNTAPTLEIKINDDWSEYDTFKVEKSNDTNFNIYTGHGGDKHHIFTPSLAFFNFDNYKEAQDMCDKLNRIANKYLKND